MDKKQKDKYLLALIFLAMAGSAGWGFYIGHAVGYSNGVVDLSHVALDNFMNWTNNVSPEAYSILNDWIQNNPESVRNSFEVLGTITSGRVLKVFTF